MNEPYDDHDDVSAYLYQLERAQQRGRGRSNLIIGLLFVLVGLAITVATFEHAGAHGGRAIVMVGPIVFGAIRFFRGLAQLGAA